MRSIGSVILLLVVLAVVAFMALRQTQTVVPSVAGSSAPAPAERMRAAQERAAGEVAKAMEAASASRSEAENR